MWSAQDFPFSQLSQRLLQREGRRNQYDEAYRCETEEPSQGDFVFPETRRYPIEDATHARDALARSSGKPEHAAVVTAVRRMYPEIEIEN